MANDVLVIGIAGGTGSGKTTILRMIAGLEDITKGNLYIDGELINSVEPKYRNIAMVFQNYALYPHMTAYNNMAFGLRNMKIPTLKVGKDGKAIKGIDKRAISDLEFELKQTYRKIKEAKKLNDIEGINGLESEILRINKDLEYFKQTPTNLYVEKHLKKSEIDQKVHEAAKILDIEDYLNRKPKALSGGQCQRVALGRAIVRNAKVFLMDEPLSNLDAKLRVQTRSEISKIHKNVGATTIYVTHDQVEAMTMADRIVVMRDGWIQQIGTPKQLFNNPANKFVASFIGAPGMNFIEGTLENDKFVMKENNKSLTYTLSPKVLEKLKDYNNKKITLGIRPEDIHIAKGKQSKFTVNVSYSELLGYDLMLYFSVGDSKVVAKVGEEQGIAEGSKVDIYFDESKLHFFDIETERSIY